MNVNLAGLSSGFQLLRGDIEDVIIDTVDADGAQPQLVDGQAAHLARFGYGFVNLDFDGGIGYRDRAGVSKRVRSLRLLLHRQSGTSFVLFLTVNVRDTMGDEVEQFLQGFRARSGDATDVDCLDWYLGRGDGEREWKLKAVVPLFIQEAAELDMFSIRCFPPVYYEGHERAHMLHFAFELVSTAGNLRAFSRQTPSEVLKLPLIVARQGALVAASEQHPSPMREEWQRALDFLPRTTLDRLVAAF